jgi:hypothetical protein
MKRIHGLFIALTLGVAAVAGTFAALETTSLGAQAATLSDGQIAAREQKLDRAEKEIRRAAERRPPALPTLPSGGSQASFADAPPPQPTTSDSSSSHDRADDDHGRHHERDDDRDDDRDDEDRDDDEGDWDDEHEDDDDDD